MSELADIIQDIMSKTMLITMNVESMTEEENKSKINEIAEDATARLLNWKESEL